MSNQDNVCRTCRAAATNTVSPAGSTAEALNDTRNTRTAMRVHVAAASTTAPAATCTSIFRTRPATSQLLLWLLHHRASSITCWLQSGLLRAQHLHGGTADLFVFLDQHGAVLAIVQRVKSACSMTLHAAAQTAVQHSFGLPVQDILCSTTGQSTAKDSHVPYAMRSSQMPHAAVTTAKTWMTTLQPTNRLTQPAACPRSSCMAPLQIWQARSAFTSRQQSAPPMPLLNSPCINLQRQTGLIASQSDAADSLVGRQPEAAARQPAAAGSAAPSCSAKSAGTAANSYTDCLHDNDHQQHRRHALSSGGNSMQATSCKLTTCTGCPIRHSSQSTSLRSSPSGVPLTAMSSRRSRPTVTRAVFPERRQRLRTLVLQGQPVARARLSQQKQPTVSETLTAARSSRRHQRQGPSASGSRAQRQQMSAYEYAAITGDEPGTQPSQQAEAANRRVEQPAVRLARLLQAHAAGMHDREPGQQQVQLHTAAGQHEQQMQNCLSEMAPGEGCQVHQSWASNPRSQGGSLRMLAHMLQWQQAQAQPTPSAAAAAAQPEQQQQIFAVERPSAVTLTAPPRQLQASMQPDNDTEETACSSQQQASQGQRRSRLRGAAGGCSTEPKAARGDRQDFEQQADCRDSSLSARLGSPRHSKPHQAAAEQHSRAEPDHEPKR